MAGESRGPIGPLSVQIQDGFIIAVRCPETGAVAITAHLLYLHVSLIMGHVYSLENQTSNRDGRLCNQKSHSRGSQNVTACKWKLNIFGTSSGETPLASKISNTVYSWSFWATVGWKSHRDMQKVRSFEKSKRTTFGEMSEQKKKNPT